MFDTWQTWVLKMSRATAKLHYNDFTPVVSSNILLISFKVLSLFFGKAVFETMKLRTPSFSWICWHLCYWKQSACHFTLLYERSRVRSLPRHTGGSFTVWWQDRFLSSRLAQAEAPNWIASGVILTCSLTVKSQMFWFILSPSSFVWVSFSAMEGFITEGLVKVGSVYTVHAGRKWCQGIYSFTWHHVSKTHSLAHAHTVSQLYKYCTVYSSLHLPPVIGSINDSLLWVNTPSHSLLRD